MSNLAIATPGSRLGLRVRQRLTGIAANDDLANALIFSNQGKTLAPESAVLNMFAPLPDRIKRLVIVREFPALYPTQFTLSWLDCLLKDMGTDGEILIESPENPKNTPPGRATSNFLMEGFKNCGVERLDKTWLRLTLKDSENLSFNSMYGRFHKSYDAFKDAYIKEFALQDTPDTDERVTRTFIYSLFGANQKSFVFNATLSQHGLTERPLKILDVGGGYGFLGAELAAQGHHVTVTDVMPQHVNIGNWLAARCGVSDRMDFRIEKIEDLAGSLGQNSYDVISFFGCLLYAERACVPDVIKSCMAALNSGGLLLIHENPKGVIKPEAKDFPICFTSEELLPLLEKYAGKPRLYNMFTGEDINWRPEGRRLFGLLPPPAPDWSGLNTRVLMTATQKP